jgi:hypothetical protein
MIHSYVEEEQDINLYINFDLKYHVYSIKMIYITLSAIPCRQESLMEVIDSLINQTQKADLIVLNVCNNYSRFPNDKFDTKPFENIPSLYINIVEDYGPSTKIMGFMHTFCSRILPDDTIIIVDDDLVYDKNLVKSLCVKEMDVVTFNYFDKLTNEYVTAYDREPVYPCFPGYLGYSFKGKFAEKLYNFFKLVISEYTNAKLHDDAIVTRFMRKNKANILWISKINTSFTKRGSHSDRNSLSVQVGCDVLRKSIVQFLNKK